jgi:hypothetical protein
VWAVRDADTVVPPPKSCLATSDPSGYSDPVPLRVHQDASDASDSCVILRQCAIGTSQMLQPRLHGNRRAGRSTGPQVHRCVGVTLDITASMCMPHPLQVVFPQRPQRAGLHIRVLLWSS